MFCRATNSPKDNQDIKAMYLDEELDPTPPADLYKCIQRLFRLLTGLACVRRKRVNCTQRIGTVMVRFVV